MKFRHGPATVISVLTAHATGVHLGRRRVSECCKSGNLPHPPKYNPSGLRVACMKSVCLLSLLWILPLAGCDSGSSDADKSDWGPTPGVDDAVTVAESDESDESADTAEADPDVLDTAMPSEDTASGVAEAEDTASSGSDTAPVDADTADTADTADGVTEDDGVFIPDWPDGTDPFGDAVVSFDPGPDAGFGSDGFPDIVLGSPRGTSGGGGSLHVLSLGELGSIVIEFTDLGIIDGPGADLLVFENPFPGWSETAFVEVSNDGETWTGWFCDAENAEEGFPGCAGIASVYATPEFLIDPTDPEVAGGDAFDLAEIGVESARFVRITDSGFNALGYGGTTGGFDLDAVGAANWTPLPSE